MQGMIRSRIQGYAIAGLAAAAMSLALAGAAQATPLQIGQSLVSDGVTFTVTACSFGGTACGSQATFVSSGGSAPGITISGTSSSIVSDPGTSHDLSVEFSASGSGINGVSLGIAGSSVGASSSASTGETVYAGDGSTSLGALNVTVGGTTSQTIAFAAQSLVYLSKDITTFAVGSGNSAAVTSVTQTLSMVPEPASIGLFFLGLLSLAGFRSPALRDALRSVRRRVAAFG